MVQDIPATQAPAPPAAPSPPTTRGLLSPGALLIAAIVLAAVAQRFLAQSRNPVDGLFFVPAIAIFVLVLVRQRSALARPSWPEPEMPPPATPVGARRGLLRGLARLSGVSQRNLLQGVAALGLT